MTKERKPQSSLVQQIIELERKAELLDSVIVCCHQDIKKNGELSTWGNKIYYIFESILGKRKARQRFREVRENFLKEFPKGNHHVN